MSSSARVACVWGANGISGLAMIDHLLEQPSSEWKKIICISRRPCQYEFDDRRIVFVSVDLLQSSVEDIVRALDQVEGRTITDVFHYTYVEKKTEEELDEMNRSVLEKALEVCAQLAGQTIRSFSLQTGYKYYGVHKGAEDLAAIPFDEDAPRHRGTNFYFTQEDLLKEYATKYRWRSIITRPSTIIGVAKGNFMNFAVTIALYASLQRELGQPLWFPGNAKSWERISDHSTASNNARFQLWAVENEKIQNEIFNIANGDFVQMKDLWPKIANYFHLEIAEQTLSENASQVKLAEYMVEHRQTWQTTVQREQLDPQAFDYATWSFADNSLKSSNDRQGDLSKARRFGWTTTVNTVDGYVECFERLKRWKVIPK